MGNCFKNGKMLSASMRVCSEHFLSEDFFFQGNKKRHYLKSNVVPSQKLPIRSHDAQETSPQKQKRKAREQRLYYRKQNQDKFLSLTDTNNDKDTIENHIVQSENSNYGNTYFVDRTEKVEEVPKIPIEKPHYVKCRILTYSNYKKRHTIKWNVAVTPSGLIVHVSSSYGGSVFLVRKDYINDERRSLSLIVTK
ncbi:PREDICTED: uncharacterized protein LOC108767468 [Trachymyrmex cornetzi]|uniref:uncharacterized protein LOC108767468 n=1 Tax=Trachymyrmex cornetzi TaxID=471704 RepID=UPI00084F2D91|nr:PREDICTED: uncharacterized protein LOC108767468 [Trachymyrmex cornetzi]